MLNRWPRGAMIGLIPSPCRLMAKRRPSPFRPYRGADVCGRVENARVLPYDDAFQSDIAFDAGGTTLIAISQAVRRWSIAPLADTPSPRTARYVRLGSKAEAGDLAEGRPVSARRCRSIRRNRARHNDCTAARTGSRGAGYGRQG